MFSGIGAGEIIIILGLALVIFGPRKLPEIGRAFGKTLNEFRRASFSNFNDIEAEIRDATEVKKPQPRVLEEVREVRSEEIEEEDVREDKLSKS